MNKIKVLLSIFVLAPFIAYGQVSIPDCDGGAGQILALPDKIGNIIGFYHERIHSSDKIEEVIRGGAIPISCMNWQDVLQNPGKWIIKDGVLILVTLASPDSVLITN